MEVRMKEFSYTVTDAQGLHARPAGLLVRAAAEFPCDVFITNGKILRNAKRIFEVMSLGIKYGDTMILKTDGEKEDEAIEALSKFCKSNL